LYRVHIGVLCQIRHRGWFALRAFTLEVGCIFTAGMTMDAKLPVLLRRCTL
jgi:hypothetical protein